MRRNFMVASIRAITSRGIISSERLSKSRTPLHLAVHRSMLPPHKGVDIA